MFINNAENLIPREQMRKNTLLRQN